MEILTKFLNKSLQSFDQLKSFTKHSCDTQRKSKILGSDSFITLGVANSQNPLLGIVTTFLLIRLQVTMQKLYVE